MGLLKPQKASHHHTSSASPHTLTPGEELTHYKALVLRGAQTDFSGDLQLGNSFSWVILRL